ncbi:MAG: TetR/AcrR family transcriptional regulator [Deltaproteobacteria bacterium]|nr:TetR/AcrR family transcriptional regulator [Deltaproteobacteria bacterium]
MTRLERKRRTPDEARRLLLDATLGLLARLGPDAFGLKDVAREAGVSHALVTHYFGTFDALIEAAFADYTTRARGALLARVSARAANDPGAWVAEAATQLADPVYGRLALWAMLSGRAEQADFFPRREQGLARVADAIVVTLAGGSREPAREEVEFAILLMLSATMGYSAAGRALWGSLGREPTAARDAWFREQLSQVIAGLTERPTGKDAGNRARRSSQSRKRSATPRGSAAPKSEGPLATRRGRVRTR